MQLLLGLAYIHLQFYKKLLRLSSTAKTGPQVIAEDEKYKTETIVKLNKVKRYAKVCWLSYNPFNIKYKYTYKKLQIVLLKL